MAEEKLGNIKGQKGDPGAKGDPGKDGVVGNNIDILRAFLYHAKLDSSEPTALRITPNLDLLEQQTYLGLTDSVDYIFRLGSQGGEGNRDLHLLASNVDNASFVIRADGGTQIKDRSDSNYVPVRADEFIIPDIFQFMPVMDRGIISTQGYIPEEPDEDGRYNGTLTHTFTSAFNTPPTVTANIQSSSPQEFMALTIINVTTTSFDVHWSRSTDTWFRIEWGALGEQF